MFDYLLPWLLLAAIAAVALHSVLLRRKLEARLGRQQAQIGDLLNELHATCHSVSAMGRRIMALEKHRQQFDNRLEEMVRNDPNRVSYTEASRLVELGAEVEDLMNSCGISRPEAELVTALSRKQLAQKQALN